MLLKSRKTSDSNHHHHHHHHIQTMTPPDLTMGDEMESNPWLNSTSPATTLLDTILEVVVTRGSIDRQTNDEVTTITT